MEKAKILLFTLALFAFGLKAQQPLWHISLLAEETLNEVGQENIQTAWFVTGKDTVYTIHLGDSKIVGRTTPYDFDTIWTDGDSLYQRHIDYLRDTEELAAYKGRKNVVIREYESGELVKKSITRHGEDWKPSFTQTWTPKGILTIKKNTNKTVTTLQTFKPLSTLYSENDGDTIRRWNVDGNDTLLIAIEWKNYSEVTKFKSKKWTKKISIGDTTIRITHYPEKTDSIFEVSIDGNLRNEQYSKPKGKNYSVISRYKTWWTAEEPKSYEHKANSDTTRHAWVYYEKPEIGINVTVPKVHWKYFYDSDSIFFKSYEIIYDQQGAQVGLNIKRKDGTTTTIAEPSYPPEPEATENQIYPIALEESYTTILTTLTPITTKIMVCDQTMDELILGNLNIYERSNEYVKFGQWWNETVIIEIGADKTISGVSRSPNSELWVDGFLLKTKGKMVSAPKKLKTVLYYIDANDKKRKQKLEYILLPVKVEARNQLEY